MDKKILALETKKKIQNFIKQNPTGIVIIRGATATGKSSLSLELSKYFDIEIISADSRQIFKYMDIGTDKVRVPTALSLDLEKSIISAKAVILQSTFQRFLPSVAVLRGAAQEGQKSCDNFPPHHQIDIVEPDETYTAGQRQQDVKKLIPEIQARGNIPFIVGGTGLYIDTIYKNFNMPEIGPDYKFRNEMFAIEEKEPGFLYKELLKIDPKEAKKNHPNSTRYIIRALEIYHKSGKTKTESFLQKPVDQPILMLGIWRDKDSTNKLITTRIKEMLKDGLIHEVKQLLDQGYTTNLQSMQGIGYKEIVGYIQGKYGLEKMEELLKKNTYHLAKKQRTWFRRYINDKKNNPRENVYYEVLDVSL